MESAGKTDINVNWLVALLKRKSSYNKPSHVDDVQIEPAVALGENFCSNVYRVNLKTYLGSGRQKTVSLIVKSFPKTGTIVEVLEFYHSFSNEIKVYKLLPLLDNLMVEFEDIRDRLWCDCIGYEPNNTIVLEDLQALGYSTMNRKEWHSLEHVTFILRSVGRFHAMTKILLGRGLIGKADHQIHFICTESPTFRKALPGCLQVLASAIEESWDEKWRGLAHRVRNQIPLICDKLMKLMSEYDPRFEVMNHGDLWTNNLMLKFTEYGNEPTSVKFIDFQFPIVYSFVWDIAYYLSTCVRSTVRRENWDFLLKTYQESLEKNLKFFNWEGYIPTLEDVHNEFDRISYVVFAIVIYSLPVTTATAEVTYDIANVLDKPPEEFLNKSIYTEDKYAKEICFDLQEFCDKGII